MISSNLQYDLFYSILRPVKTFPFFPTEFGPNSRLFLSLQNWVNLFALCITFSLFLLIFFCFFFLQNVLLDPSFQLFPSMHNSLFYILNFLYFLLSYCLVVVYRIFFLFIFHRFLFLQTFFTVFFSPWIQLTNSYFIFSHSLLLFILNISFSLRSPETFINCSLLQCLFLFISFFRSSLDSVTYDFHFLLFNIFLKLLLLYLIQCIFLFFLFFYFFLCCPHFLVYRHYFLEFALFFFTLLLELLIFISPFIVVF